MVSPVRHPMTLGTGASRKFVWPLTKELPSDLVVREQGLLQRPGPLYVHRPQPAEREEPIQKQDAEDIEVQESGNFSPTA